MTFPFDDKSTVVEFWENDVLARYRDFGFAFAHGSGDHQTSVRRAIDACVALSAIPDHVAGEIGNKFLLCGYGDNLKIEDPDKIRKLQIDYRNTIARKPYNKEFELVCDIANSYKHRWRSCKKPIFRSASISESGGGLSCNAISEVPISSGRIDLVVAWTERDESDSQTEMPFETLYEFALTFWWGRGIGEFKRLGIPIINRG